MRRFLSKVPNEELEKRLFVSKRMCLRKAPNKEFEERLFVSMYIKGVCAGSERRAGRHAAEGDHGRRADPQTVCTLCGKREDLQTGRMPQHLQDFL